MNFKFVKQMWLLLFIILADAKYIGWWDVGDDPRMLPKNTNLIFWEERVEILRAAQALNMTAFYNVHHMFWEGIPLKLVGDFRGRWARAKQNLTFVDGFFLGDELLWNGVAMENISTVAQMIKGDFPDRPLWLNEALLKEIPTWPPEIDWISLDIYFGMDDVRGIYEMRLYPKMWPHQVALFCPPAYGEETGLMTIWAKKMYDWMCVDERLVGLAPWHWIDLWDRPGYERGAQSNIELTEVWESLECSGAITLSYMLLPIYCFLLL
jgi:hypothetical protein